MLRSGIAQISILIIVVGTFTYTLYSILTLSKPIPVHAMQTTSQMYNCGNPEGLEVIETGRMIGPNETFEMIGNEIVDEDGLSTVRVFDGTIRKSDLFICEVK
jgi:hypothetical protein